MFWGSIEIYFLPNNHAEAKAKVNELAKKGISANAYTSDAGEEVSTVAVK